MVSEPLAASGHLDTVLETWHNQVFSHPSNTSTAADPILKSWVVEDCGAKGLTSAALELRQG